MRKKELRGWQVNWEKEGSKEKSSKDVTWNKNGLVVGTHLGTIYGIKKAGRQKEEKGWTLVFSEATFLTYGPQGDP